MDIEGEWFVVRLRGVDGAQLYRDAVFDRGSDLRRLRGVLGRLGSRQISRISQGRLNSERREAGSFWAPCLILASLKEEGSVSQMLFCCVERGIAQHEKLKA